MANNELLEIVGPALVAGLMIAFTHAPFGLEVLKRGIIFIDLAIAQFAGLGMVGANLVWHEPAWWMIQIAALGSALLAALFFRITEKILPEEQEAIIGSSFVLASATALLLLADQPHGGEEIQHLLSGQILFVAWHDVIFHAPIYACILILWFSWSNKTRGSEYFYLLFAIAITSSVQLVGVFVVFASLILPALAAAKSERKLPVAWGCGMTSVVTGIAISAFIDAPAGPVIVLTFAITAVIIRVASAKLKYLSRY
jgi:zinc/manganese transport system permease protein